MKKFFTLAVATLFCLGASAQLISSNMVTREKKAKTGYNRLGLSYNSIKFSSKSDAFNGLSLDWAKGISVSSTMPLYIETGIGLTYGWLSETESLYGYEISLNQNYLGLKVPVNITYKYEVIDNFRIAPFLGIYFKGNLLGNSKMEAGGTEIEEDFYEDYGATRFNFGIGFGVNVEYKKGYLGISYAKDLNKFIDDKSRIDNGSVGTFAVTLGLVY